MGSRTPAVTVPRLNVTCRRQTTGFCPVCCGRWSWPWTINLWLFLVRYRGPSSCCVLGGNGCIQHLGGMSHNEETQRSPQIGTRPSNRIPHDLLLRRTELTQSYIRKYLDIMQRRRELIVLFRERLLLESILLNPEMEWHTLLIKNLSRVWSFSTVSYFSDSPSP
jgi:hypothetical protein